LRRRSARLRSVTDTSTKDTRQEKTNETATGEDERGDLLIRGFWASGTDCILDVRVTDTDSKFYCKRAPSKVLESQEKEKKRKYLEACLEYQQQLSVFICPILNPERKIFEPPAPAPSLLDVLTVQI
jgi:hypothetical protein